MRACVQASLGSSTAASSHLAPYSASYGRTTISKLLLAPDGGKSMVRAYSVSCMHHLARMAPQQLSSSEGGRNNRLAVAEVVAAACISSSWRGQYCCWHACAQQPHLLLLLLLHTPARSGKPCALVAGSRRAVRQALARLPSWRSTMAAASTACRCAPKHTFRQRRPDTVHRTPAPQRGAAGQGGGAHV